jgi:hypothetical protein
MKGPLILITALLLLASTVHGQELTELARLYGPPEGLYFYHISGPGDVNGDGFDDFIISSPARDRNASECENGYARLYFGGNPIDTSNYITIPAVCDEIQIDQYSFGLYSAEIGDFNGDDFPDFMIGDPGYDYNYAGPWETGAGFVYWGGPTIDTLPGLRLVSEAWNAHCRLSGLGDVNGDEYNDIISTVGWFTLADDFDSVCIYLGGESPDSIPDLKINPYIIGGYPVMAEPAKIIGDYNGDGYDDLVFCNAHAGTGYAFLFFGSVIGFDDPDLIFNLRVELLSGCGDMNSDGFDDFMMTDNNKVFIYFGSPYPDTSADVIIREEDDPYNAFGSYLTGGSDLNMDGFSDIAVSDYNWSDQYTFQGRVLIYFGGEDFDSLSDIQLYGEFNNQCLGAETAFPGDINGDGYPEFIASSTNGNNPGYAFVTIYTTGIVSVPDDGHVPDDYDFNLTSYPNPFNAATTISFDLPVSSNVRLEVYNLIGQKITTLADGRAEAERHSITWNADHLPSGIYFARLKTAGNSVTLRMMLLK